jgi:hypothetical protein
MDKNKIYIGASKGISKTSRIIRWFQWGKRVTHIFYVVPGSNFDDPIVIESLTSLGVIKSNLKANHKPGTEYDIYSIETSSEKASIMDYHMHKKIGTPYDFIGLIGFGTRLNNTHDRGKEFCSETVSDGLLKTGIRLFRSLLPHQTTPHLFTESLILKHEYSGVV